MGLQKPTSFNYISILYIKFLFLCVVKLLSLVVELLVVVDGGLLVLLVLGDQVVHVALGLSELHLIHALISVPVEESLGTVGE